MTCEDLAKLQLAYMRANNALMDAKPEVLALIPGVYADRAAEQLEGLRERCEAITEEASHETGR